MASASILTEKAPGKPVPTLSVLAVSGPDNVGKSTQLRILARRIGPCAALAGSLDAYDPRWRTITALGMADWWFDQASIEEVADVLACSYLERARQAPSSGLRLVDRGIPCLRHPSRRQRLLARNCPPMPAKSERDLFLPLTIRTSERPNRPSTPSCFSTRTTWTRGSRRVWPASHQSVRSMRLMSVTYMSSSGG
jgi:hypothetical protein